MAKAALDWNKVRNILAKEDFALVTEQRTRFLELTRILATPIPKVDLAHYKSVLANQQVLAEVESALKSFQPKKANVAAVMDSLKEQRIAALESAKLTVSEVNKQVSGFKSGLDGIKNLQHFDELRPEHIYEAAPGLEGVYYDRLKEGKVYHDDHNFGEKFIG